MGSSAAGQPIPPLRPQGGRYGLPADLIVGSDGRVLACKYGKHASDQWSVDELLDEVEMASNSSSHKAR